MTDPKKQEKDGSISGNKALNSPRKRGNEQYPGAAIAHTDQVTSLKFSPMIGALDAIEKRFGINPDGIYSYLRHLRIMMSGITDPIAWMLADQLIVAHHQIIAWQFELANANSKTEIQECLRTVTNLMAEFRRGAVALESLIPAKNRYIEAEVAAELRGDEASNVASHTEDAGGSVMHNLENSGLPSKAKQTVPAPEKKKLSDLPHGTGKTKDDVARSMRIARRARAGRYVGDAKRHTKTGVAK